MCYKDRNQYSCYNLHQFWEESKIKRGGRVEEKIRVGPDLVFLAGCWISGWIIRHVLSDNAGYSRIIRQYLAGCRIFGQIYPALPTINPALPDIRPNPRKNEETLEAVFLLELPVLLDEGVDAVNHLLDELDFAVAQAVLVGDVVGDAGLTARLAAGAAGLEVQVLTAHLQNVNPLLGVAGQVHMARGPHAGA